MTRSSDKYDQRLSELSVVSTFWASPHVALNDNASIASTHGPQIYNLVSQVLCHGQTEIWLYPLGKKQNKKAISWCVVDKSFCSLTYPDK